MKQLWNERFSENGFAYGKEPNEYFKLELDKIKSGRLLLIGEGEGRNAVYAAKLGWQVDAIDFSEAAKKKALSLSEENNVKINYSIHDLNEFEPDENSYDAVGIIYVHLEENLRKRTYQKAVNSLKPDGRIILELYSKDQIANTSGGPKELDLLYSLEEAVSDFIDLEFKNLVKEDIILEEGKYHIGKASVIRFCGSKNKE